MPQAGPSRKAMRKPPPPPETTPKPQERPAEKLGASSANTPAFIAPRQGGRSLPIPKAVGSVPSGSTARLSLGADLPVAPTPFMANPLFATSAGSGLVGAIRAKGPSVISVTYGVVVTDPRTHLISRH